MPRKKQDKAADPAFPSLNKPLERWPLIRQFKAGTGVFRPRIIPWTRFATYALNPYTMGLTAHFCVHVANVMSLFSGGTFDPRQRFQPPPHLRDAFLASYNLVKEPGKWLALSLHDPKDETRHELFEHDFAMKRKPHELFEMSETDWWNGWFASKEAEINSIHDMLTAEGIGELRFTSVPLLEWAAQPVEDQQAIIETMYEKDRLALA